MPTNRITTLPSAGWWKRHWSPELHLRLLRMTHNMSLRDIQSLTGLSHESVRRAEQSTHKVSQETLETILSVFGVDPTTLLHMPESYVSDITAELEKPVPDILLLLIKLHGTTATSLAKQANLSNMTVFKLLNRGLAAANPRLSTLISLASVLNTSVCSILCNQYFNRASWPELANSIRTQLTNNPANQPSANADTAPNQPDQQPVGPNQQEE